MPRRTKDTEEKMRGAGWPSEGSRWGRMAWVSPALSVAALFSLTDSGIVSANGP